jgi:hypothetical protein
MLAQLHGSLVTQTLSLLSSILPVERGELVNTVQTAAGMAVKALRAVVYAAILIELGRPELAFVSQARLHPICSRMGLAPTSAVVALPVSF